VSDQVTPPPVAEQARVEADAAATAAAPRITLLTRVSEVRNLGLVGVLAILGIIGAITADTFWTRSNLLTILQQASVIGVISVGMTFVIIGGGIDLSVGKVMALASVWSTTVATQSYGPVVMVLCALLVGMGAGLVNGLLIAYGQLVPFIATLAMLAAARGLAERISKKQTQLVTQDAINNLATTKPLGISLLVWIFAVVAVVGWIVLNRTTYGRRTFAIGGNLEAARRLVEAASLEARQAITALRTGRVSWEEFTRTLGAFADEFANNHDVEVRLTAKGQVARIDADLQAEVLRLLQETFSNAIRHGGARVLNVEVDAAAGALEISVRDDGRGFDPHAALAGPGVGLKSIGERLGRRAGTLRLISAEGQGAVVRGRLPLVSQPPGLAA